MIRVRPFAALRPMPHLAAHVASVPYDVVNTDEARVLAEGEPSSFLHVVRPEIDLPPGTGAHDEAVYAKGRENLDRLRKEGILVRDDRPRMFLYRQVLHHHSQIGLVCCCHVDDYNRDLIKKHEKTRPDKEDDRTRHLLSLNAHAGPVFMTYRDQADVDRLVFADTNERPLYHFNAPDGVTHTAWEVHDSAAYAAAFGGIDALYVADGHHRSASAARAAEVRRGDNPGHTGDEEYNWFLSVLFPASQLTILPYNRTVQGLHGLSVSGLLDALRGVATLTETDTPEPDRAGVFGIFLEDRWYRLELDPDSIDRDDPIASLDVSLLHTRVLEPILGVGDARTDPRLDFVGGIRGSAELADRVGRGAADAAFTLHATGINQLLAVADAGLVMPPKSTWFEPKLRSGLFVHELD